MRAARRATALGRSLGRCGRRPKGSGLIRVDCPPLVPGLPTTWSPWFYVLRVRQLVRTALGYTDWPLPPPHVITRHPAVRGYCAEAGVRSLRCGSPLSGFWCGWVVVCPRCGREARGLWLGTDGRWWCRACVARWRRPSLLATGLGDYLFALRIGYRGPALGRHHAYLGPRWADLWRRARVGREQRLVVAGSEVLRYAWWWGASRTSTGTPAEVLGSGLLTPAGYAAWCRWEGISAKQDGLGEARPGAFPSGRGVLVR